jgi:hypothetical protein
LPAVSATDVMVDVASRQPTTTTLVSAADSAAAYVAFTD